MTKERMYHVEQCTMVRQTQAKGIDRTGLFSLLNQRLRMS